MNELFDDEDMIKNLNPQQQQAVLHDKGPLLILAGAGSGKTRVITHRIAYLVKTRGVSPYRILAITFTNKAAKEMKTRIEELIGQDVNNMWVGTFHAMFVKMLRKHSDLLGFDKTFTIIDSDDQLKVVKQCIAELNLDEKMFQPRSVHAQISAAKNSLIGVDEFSDQAGRDFRLSAVAKIYDLYQKKLKQNGVLDFDDILYYAVMILQQNPELLDFYQRKFEYILVDEYQDTNHAQYTLIKLLAARHHNLCVVGDDDQSIYSFRGANIQNILDFEKDFKNCEVIKLEQNYRSTGNVLDAANSLIAHNKARKNKKLWTCAEAGDPITFMRTENQNDEAACVASEIRRIVQIAKCGSYKEIAILYRLNALSRNFEGALSNKGIPFKIYGGTRFYDRKEIKDLLAYLRLIIKGDNLSFERVINIPRRGIGDVTIETIAFISDEHKISYLDVCGIAKDEPRLSRTWPKLFEFYELILRFREVISLNKMSLPEFFDYVQNESGILQEIIDQRDKKNEITDRVENLKELLSDAVEFEKRFEPANIVVTFNPSESEPGEYEEAVETPKDLYGKLTEYLENIALYTDQDQNQEVIGENFVKLMTIHSAKGLEFDHIFLVGAEESLFPGSRSILSGREEDLEEERRLAYVAITRARKKLVITTAKSRMLYGKTECYPVSRFVKEIPEKYIEEIGGSRFESSSGSYDFGTTRDFGAAREKHISGEKKNTISDNGKKDHFFDFSALMGTKNSTVNNGAAGGSGGKIYLKAEEVKVGDEVVHDKFGQGKIISSLPVANDAILEIKFNDFGVKKLLANQAKLSKPNR